MVSKPFLRKNRKFPQAHLSYVDAGKLIRMPLRSYEMLSPGPTLSHPLTFGKSQASVRTLVKISFGVKMSPTPMCKFLRWLQGRRCQSTYDVLAERAAGQGCVSGVPKSLSKFLIVVMLQFAHLLNGSNRVVGSLAKRLTLLEPGLYLWVLRMCSVKAARDAGDVDLGIWAPGTALTNRHTPGDLEQQTVIFLPVLEVRFPRPKCWPGSAASEGPGGEFSFASCRSSCACSWAGATSPGPLPSWLHRLLLPSVCSLCVSV